MAGLTESSGFYYLPLNSVQCSITCHEASGKLHCTLERPRVKKPNTIYKSHFGLTDLQQEAQEPLGSLGHTWRTTALVPPISPLFRWENWGFQWESVFLRFLSWPVAQVEDETSYLSPRFSPQNNVYLLLDFVFNTKQIPRHLIMLKMKPQLLK